MSTRFNQLSLLSLILLSLSFLTSACQMIIPVTRVETNINDELRVRALDYSFEAPTDITAGRYWVTLENYGKELHHLQFMRLNDGFTFHQLFIEIQTDPDEALAKMTFPGGVGAIEPGKTGTVVIDLEEGLYVLADFLPDAEGVPHLALGMLSPLRVAPNPHAPTLNASGPEPHLSVTLRDFSFSLPPEIKEGPQLWKVTNDGPQLHEIMLVRLSDGKTITDVIAFMNAPAGPPPFESIGGMQALSVGKTGWVHLDLLPGVYAALCLLPELQSGHSHLEMGMVTTFVVR